LQIISAKASVALVV